MKNIDFEKLNKLQKASIQSMLNEKEEKENLLEPIRKYYKNQRGYIKYHIITDEIVVAEMNNPFQDDEDLKRYESFYEAFVNGKKVLQTGTFSKDGAILLGVAAKYEEASAYPYLAKIVGIKDL